jgi:hypothetical protein
MEDAIEKKQKLDIFGLFAAVVLIVLRAFLNYVIAIRKGGSPSYAFGYIVAGAVVSPAIVAGLFCIPKKGRNLRRFTIGFAVVSLIMLLRDIDELRGTPH